VPVTVRFSSKFYERLGDDVAGELVDWCNTVDEAYRNQLKEMNESFWERLKDHLDAGLGGTRSEMSNMRADLRTEMANMRADLLKWMFLFWLGNAGLMVGLRLFGPR
jgi:hypothetical protein